jgi:IS5 family transposase
MIEARRQQLHFGEGLIAEEVSDLREEWMNHADQVLEDEQLVSIVYEALAHRSPKSRTRGRRGTPAEVVLRLLLLKHIRNWSYEVLEREVRANLVYRDFTRVGAGKAPDAKTMGRWGLALGPEGVEKTHKRVVGISQNESERPKNLAGPSVDARKASAGVNPARTRSLSSSCRPNPVKQ